MVPDTSSISHQSELRESTTIKISSATKDSALLVALLWSYIALYILSVASEASHTTSGLRGSCHNQKLCTEHQNSLVTCTILRFFAKIESHPSQSLNIPEVPATANLKSGQESHGPIDISMHGPTIIFI